MKRLLLSTAVAMLIALAAAPATVRAQRAQDFSGTWQGVLKVPGITARRILKISRTASGALTATMYSPDEMDIPVHVNSITQRGDTVTMRIDVDNGDWADYHRVYTAKLSAGGNTLNGTWTTPQGPSFPMNFQRASAATAWAIKAMPAIKYVTIAGGVKLETFDWGGSGRPVVFLPGLGSTADIFNKCAHILTAHYHVYGINPPAFGASDKPAPIQANYSADRLGDDVVAALNALHIENPILLGHSIAGEELSDIGTRYPHRVAALIYLDAAYSYAFYSPTSGAWTRSILDADDLRQKMLGLDSGFPSQRALNEAENADLVHIRQDLQLQQAGLNALPPPPPPGFAQKDPFAPYATAILSGEQKFTAPMRLPILAIFAEPMNRQMFRQDKSSATIAAIDAIEKDKNAHIAAFARAQPTAHIAKIANADHFLFLSNQAETLRAIEAFLAGLPVT